jgi:NitT/TauT family transport system permease protein
MVEIEAQTATAESVELPPWYRRRGFERMLSVLSPILIVALWELGARTGMIDVRFFPAPTRIFQAFLEMLQPTDDYPRGELITHFGDSLGRVAVGFVLGAIPGIAIGLAMGLISWVRALIQPLVDGTYPIPKIAILPLFIMLLGIGEESKYAIIAVAVIYQVLINTVAGVRNIDRIYLDVGKNFHASRVMMFLDVALPGALPVILTGLKLGMGVALLVIVSAEFVGAKSGIGYLIWSSWQVFQIEKMYVGLLLSATLGFGSAILLNWLEHKLVPWKPR